MDFSYVHIRYFIGYVYHICLQDTIQSTLLLCLRCHAMLLPMPLRPLLLTTRSGFTAWWLARLYACFRKVAPWPYPLTFSLWSTATTHPQCHCTPRHPRARSFASSRQAKARLAWHGMVWYGMAWCESQML